jgi:hypothetical protein
MESLIDTASLLQHPSGLPQRLIIGIQRGKSNRIGVQVPRVITLSVHLIRVPDRMLNFSR